MSSPLVAHPFYVTRHSFKISRQNLKFEISQSKDWEIKSTILNGLRAPDWSIYTTLYTILRSDWWASYTTLSRHLNAIFVRGRGNLNVSGCCPGEWKKEEGFDRVEELQLAEKIGLEPLFVHLYSFYLQGYFNTLRMEVYDKNVGVTMICLGLTYSNLFRNAYRENLEVCRWNFTVII